MNIPAHRAAAVAPTPAHSFELRAGELVNLTEEARKATEAAAVPVPINKGRRPAIDAPATPAPTAE